MLDVFTDRLLACLATLKSHLLPSLLEFHIAPLKVAVDRVAEDSDLRVQLIVFSLIKLWFEAIRLCCLQLTQLLVDLLEHVFNLLGRVDPDRWKC